MARTRQGAYGLREPLLILAILIYLGIAVALFRKFGGEACEVFLFCSSLTVTLIRCLWEWWTGATPQGPFAPPEQKPVTYQEK